MAGMIYGNINDYIERVGKEGGRYVDVIRNIFWIGGDFIGCSISLASDMTHHRELEGRGK